MAPPTTPKPTLKEQRTIVKSVAKSRPTPISNIKKTISTKKTGEKVPLTVSNTIEVRKRSSTVPKASSPKPKKNKPVPLPGSVVQSAKKPTWKRRPKPAHSGVPVPEKMKRLLGKQLQDSDCSF